MRNEGGGVSEGVCEEGRGVREGDEKGRDEA